MQKNRTFANKISLSRLTFLGPVVTNHQEPLAVFQNGDCLVIPMTVFDCFKDYADGFDVNITFSVGNDTCLVDEAGHAKRFNCQFKS